VSYSSTILLMTSTRLVHVSVSCSSAILLMTSTRLVHTPLPVSTYYIISLSVCQSVYQPVCHVYYVHVVHSLSLSVTHIMYKLSVLAVCLSVCLTEGSASDMLIGSTISSGLTCLRYRYRREQNLRWIS